MVIDTFNGKIINESKFNVTNKNEICYVNRNNIDNKIETLIKLIKVFDSLSKGECIVLKYIIESKIRFYEDYKKIVYEFDANSDFCIDIERTTGYNYVSIKDSISNLHKKNIIIKCRVPDTDTDTFYKNRYLLNSQYCPKNIITNDCKSIIIDL